MYNLVISVWTYDNGHMSYNSRLSMEDAIGVWDPFQ